MGANQAPLLEALLAQPQWLHNKLRAYGVAFLVSDFRRCVVSLLSPISSCSKHLLCRPDMPRLCTSQCTSQ